MQNAKCKMQNAKWRMASRWSLLQLAALVLSGMSCAKAPGGGGSGLRLVVTMQVAGIPGGAGINDAYHYFFLIRNLGDDVGQNGPVPVWQTPYGGNGFATGKTATIPAQNGTAAFTDYVEYNRTDQFTTSGYTVYHIPGGTQANVSHPNPGSLVGDPVSTQPPNGGRVLQFELDLSQIAPTPSDVAPNPDLRPRYLQVNFITTSDLPANSSIFDNIFATDAIGDQSSPNSGSFNTYITIDTTQVGKIYASDQPPGPSEPPDDVLYHNDPQLDITYWSVQVVKR